MNGKIIDYLGENKFVIQLPEEEEWNYTLNYYNYHHIDRDEPAWKIAVDNITKLLN